MTKYRLIQNNIHSFTIESFHMHYPDLRDQDKNYRDWGIFGIGYTSKKEALKVIKEAIKIDEEDKQRLLLFGEKGKVIGEYGYE